MQSALDERERGEGPASPDSYCLPGGALTLCEAGPSIKNQRNLRLTSEGDEMDGGELPANLKTHYHFRLQKHQESNSLPTRLFGGIESLKND